MTPTQSTSPAKRQRDLDDADNVHPDQSASAIAATELSERTRLSYRLSSSTSKRAGSPVRDLLNDLRASKPAVFCELPFTIPLPENATVLCTTLTEGLHERVIPIGLKVLDIYDALVRAGAGGALSQTMDSSMKRRLLFSGLEVKNENGGKDEALAQLATWIAAGMENTRKLWGQSSEEERPYCDLPPMVGWTVVGHDWHTWVTFGATKNGTDRLVRNSLPTLSKLS
ncbi:hypothetical protein APSETT445_002243 [Aspergillus pseudonomiae]